MPVISKSRQTLPKEGRVSPDRRMMYYLFLPGFLAIFLTTISNNPALPLLSQAIGANDMMTGLVAAVSLTAASCLVSGRRAV